MKLLPFFKSINYLQRQCPGVNEKPCSELEFTFTNLCNPKRQQMKYISKCVPLFFYLFLIHVGTEAQSIQDSTAKKIDDLFKEWNHLTSPGCAIGIVRNDSLIYAKGYGMANLEYGIPNTPETIFHMASVSKQFTAFSILLLERQGKLKLDDDIRKYLPWFPDLKEKITILNLLNHTSGIRDQWQLLAISGTRIDDVITQEHIVKILSKQKALNFKPGTEYSYSNSGFTLLAEIVKAVSGESLRKFTDSAIFKPLGMNSTHFHDDYTEMVKNRAYSYDHTDSIHFANDILSYSNVGATSLFTNINDMSKWVMNFYDHKVGDQETIDVLTKKAKLKGGQELNYALGIVSSDYKGWKLYSHNGADAGYRTAVSVFPDQKMGFIVFSNLDEMDAGGLSSSMTELFITEKKGKNATIKMDSSLAIIKDSSLIKKYLGDYICEEGLAVRFILKNSRLYYQVYGKDYLLNRILADSFINMQHPEYNFAFKISGKDTLAEFTRNYQFLRLKKYISDSTRSDQVLQAFTGIFYCPELDCKYGIILKDHHLMLTNAKYNDTQLTVVGSEHLTNDFWWMDHLFILRDKKNHMIGFDINSDRIMHLRFNKVD